MPKNIVLLSDGTGNAAAKVWRTNVWRTYQALELRDGRKQIARYDDGVGTSAFKPLALLGGAFGFGLKRNVINLYKFASANYKPGDRIYCFGFSRGAYTIRLVASLIAIKGLIPPGLTGEAFDLRALDMYRAYRQERFRGIFPARFIVWTLRRARNLFISIKRKLSGQPKPDYRDGVKSNVEFLGVWDTVAAYGLPVHEMVRGIDVFLWPIAPTDRVLAPEIQHARHALSIDDERTTFHPLLWTEVHPKNTHSSNTLKQVWFAGVHSNVGGGYPDDSLSYVPLDWMMSEAEQRGLVFASGTRKDINTAAKKAKLRLRLDENSDRSPVVANGKIYDSRHGVASYYRFGPRPIAALCDVHSKWDGRDNVKINQPKIHHTVFDRIRSGGDLYAPIGLPHDYAVVMADGSVRSMQAAKVEDPSQAKNRFNSQEHVWNIVWLRRVLYFITLFFVIYILARPVIPGEDAVHALFRSISSSTFLAPLFAIFEPVVSALLNIVSLIVPAFVAEWVAAIAEDRGPFFVQIMLLGLLLSLGSTLKQQTKTRMRALWDHLHAPPKRVVKSRPPADILYKLRMSGWYKWLVRAMKRWILPVFFAACFFVILAYAGFVVYGRSYTTWQLVNGNVCTASGATQQIGTANSKIDFTTKKACNATRLLVKQGERYCIRFVSNTTWRDGETVTGLEGITFSEAGWYQRLGIPLRRLVFEPYFRPIARIGSSGADEYALAPQSAQAGIPSLDNLHVEIRARTSGELFLFVNDVLLPPPYEIDKLYYKNNMGTALVYVNKLERNERCNPLTVEGDAKNEIKKEILQRQQSQ